MDKVINPWDKPPSESAIDFKPLFDDTHHYSLSELDVSPLFRQFFSAGHVLAGMHSLGMLHGDLHKDHVFFDPTDGTTMVIDPGNSRMGQVNPELAALDLTAPFISLQPEEFLALLAGYIKECYLRLDTQYAGFTEELLQYLGGKPTSVPKPRPSYIDVPDFLGRLGIDISDKDDRLILCKSGEPTSPNLWDDNTNELFIFLIGLLLAGFDCSHLLKDWGLRYPLSDTGKHFHNVLSQLYSSTPLTIRENYNSEELTIGANFLKRLQDELGFPYDTLSDCQPYPKGCTQLQKCLRDYSPEIGNHFVDKLIDVSDFLAKHFGTKASGEQRYLGDSIRFAQHSCTLMQCSARDPRLDEIRVSTLIKRHLDFPWSSDFLEDYHSSNFINEVCYTNSRSSTFLQLFLLSIEPAIKNNQNAIWSLIWRALMLNRQAIIQLFRYLIEHPDAAERQDVLTLIIPNTIRKHAYTLQQYCLALTETGHASELLFSRYNDSPKLMQEFEWLLELSRYLENHPLDTPDAKTLFEKGINELKGVNRSSIMDLFKAYPKTLR